MASPSARFLTSRELLSGPDHPVLAGFVVCWARTQLGTSAIILVCAYAFLNNRLGFDVAVPPATYYNPTLDPAFLLLATRGVPGWRWRCWARRRAAISCRFTYRARRTEVGRAQAGGGGAGLLACSGR